MDSNRSSDRRKYLRVSMKDVKAALTCPRPSVAVDISLGGIRFYSPVLQIGVGDTLHIELVLDGNSVHVVGTVVRVTKVDDSAQEVSLAFSDLDPETQRLLEKVLPRVEA